MAKRKAAKNGPDPRSQSPESKTTGQENSGQGSGSRPHGSDGWGGTRDLGPATDPNWPRDLRTRLDRLGGAKLEVCVEMGRKQMPLEQIVNFEPGNIIELEKLSGMPMEILVNGTLFGRGEVVVVGDSLAIRITELFKTE